MKKVAVWGKFDGLHKGHLEFLKNAKELGDELYVVIIPDETIVENIGSIPTKKAEERKRDLKKLEFITDIYIDSLTNGLYSILNLKPDIFAFGYDQKTKWEKRLQDYLSSKGLYLKYIHLDVYYNGIHTSNLKSRATHCT